MKKKVSSIVALLIAATLVITVGVGSSWFSNWNVKTWFNSWGQETKQPNEPNKDTPNTPDEKIDSGNVTVSVPIESELMRLSATPLANAAEESYSLTATISPAEATNKSVDWVLSWKNASSAWASGKTVTDYVTIEPLEDGSTTATLKCVEPFGEQITVTVVSRDNENIQATCTVDYRKRLLGVTSVLSNTAGAGGPLSETEATSLRLYASSSASTNYNLSVTLNESAGTISNDYSYEFYILGSSDLVSAMNSLGSVNGSKPPVRTDKDIRYKFADKVAPTKAFDKDFFFDKVIYMDLDWYEDDYDASCNKIISHLSGSLHNTRNLLAPTLYLTYGGKEYVTTYQAKLDLSAVKVNVNSVSLNLGNITF